MKNNLIKENITIDDKLNIIYYEMIKRKYNNNTIENIINLEYLNNNKNNKGENKNIKLNKTKEELLIKDNSNSNKIEEFYTKIVELFI